MRKTQVSVAAILCAAGSSSRMGGVKKEFLPLPENSFTVLGSAAHAFAVCSRIVSIVIVVPPGAEEEARSCLPEELCSGDFLDSRFLFTSGGDTRRASVHNALLRLESCPPTHVLIHDGARPWIQPELIEKIIDAAVKYEAVIPALPLLETPKELIPQESGMDGENAAFIKRHLRRADLCVAQTPQGFLFGKLLAAHEKAAKREAAEPALRRTAYTDDAEVWGEFAGEVAVISGDPANRKITFPEDIWSRL